MLIDRKEKEGNPYITEDLKKPITARHIGKANGLPAVTIKKWLPDLEITPRTV